MECVGTSCKQKAQVDFDLACDLQDLPCFGRKWGFWCTRVFEDWLARVFDLRQYAKLGSNVYKAWFYQISKICVFCKLTWFLRKV